MNIIRYARNQLTGTWSLYLPDRETYVSDQRAFFWTKDVDLAIRFVTQADAQLCANYLATSVAAGVKCDHLIVRELPAQMHGHAHTA